MRIRVTYARLGGPTLPEESPTPRAGARRPAREIAMRVRRGRADPPLG
jgi:hypothetical protein